MGATWPSLYLTEDEKRFVRTYPDADRPGVLPRVYVLPPLIASNIAGEESRAITRFVPSRRRTRVHSVTFSGDLGNWSVSLRTGSGEVLVESAQVTALLNGPQLTPAGFAPDWTAATTLLARVNPGILAFDPNIVLSGSDQLIFEGVDALFGATPNTRTVLNVAVHVWEFPTMEEAARLDSSKRGP